MNDLTIFGNPQTRLPDPTAATSFSSEARPLHRDQKPVPLLRQP